MKYEQTPEQLAEEERTHIVTPVFYDVFLNDEYLGKVICDLMGDSCKRIPAQFNLCMDLIEVDGNKKVYQIRSANV